MAVSRSSAKKPVQSAAPLSDALAKAERKAAIAKKKAREAKASLKKAKKVWKNARKAAKAARRELAALQDDIAAAEKQAAAAEKKSRIVRRGSARKASPTRKPNQSNRRGAEQDQGEAAGAASTNTAPDSAVPIDDSTSGPPAAGS